MMGTAGSIVVSCTHKPLMHSFGTLQAMKHLMIKRPLNTDRTAFFAQAETFAAMIKLEFVLVPGTHYSRSGL